MTKKALILVEVEGGIADVTACSQPYETFILDWDNVEQMSLDEARDLLTELRAFKKEGCPVPKNSIKQLAETIEAVKAMAEQEDHE